MQNENENVNEIERHACGIQTSPFNHTSEHSVRWCVFDSLHEMNITIVGLSCPLLMLIFPVWFFSSVRSKILSDPNTHTHTHTFSLEHTFLIRFAAGCVELLYI